MFGFLSFLSSFTKNGRCVMDGVHVDRYTVSLGMHRPRYENPHPSNDRVTVPVGDKPEIANSP